MSSRSSPREPEAWFVRALRTAALTAVVAGAAASLGLMLSDSRNLMETAPWLMIFPGLAIMISILGFNLLGDALRDILDPRMRRATA